MEVIRKKNNECISDIVFFTPIYCIVELFVLNADI